MTPGWPTRGSTVKRARLDFRVIGVSPFERPCARLVVGLSRTGALGVLDLGGPADEAQTALREVARRARGEFGVRIPARLDFDATTLPERASVDTAGCMSGET